MSQKEATRKILKFPLSTEKSIRLMESENTLIFVVDKKADKKGIRDATEEMFKVKVASVRTMISPEGEKRAFIRFSKETPAIDIATQMGLM